MGWVARGGGTNVEGRRGKKRSNAMSHFALAAGVGDRERGSRWEGTKGENTFACCMKLDAICHPSWAASWVRALGLTGLRLPPPYTQSYPPTLTNTLLLLCLSTLQQWAWQLLWLCMVCTLFICVCIGRRANVCVRACVWGGGLRSDLNTSDIVVSPGRNSWSAGERGGRGQG